MSVFKRYFIRKNKNKIILVSTLFILLFIGVGYSLIWDLLSINGTTTITKDNWSVHFVNNTIDDSTSSITGCSDMSTCASVSKRATVSDNTKIDFNVSFNTLNDYYEFTVDLTNDGDIDAMLYEVVKNGITNDNSSYLTYTVEYAHNYNPGGTAINQYDSLDAGETVTIKVKLSLSTTPPSELSVDSSVKINYENADENVVERKKPHEYYVSKIMSNNSNVEQVNISTTDHTNELRFIGSNPNNYVIFNNEATCDSNNENCTDVKWRIIGVFDGQLKLIRESIGSYSWDTSGVDVNRGYGVNQWGPSTYTDTTAYSGSDLMKLLNPGYESNQDLQCKTNSTYDSTNYIINCGDNSASAFNEDVTVNNSLYWTGGSGLCYNYGSYQTTSCNFSATGLTDTTSRNMIDDTTWYLGSNSKDINIWTNDNFNGPAVYTWERQNTNLGKQCSNATHCSDTVNRTPSWTGKVGLMYPSDYIYATAGGNTYNRDTCLAKSSGYTDGSWQNWSNTYTDCYSNDWLKSSSWYWSLSPRGHSDNARDVFFVSSSGSVSSIHAYNAGVVRPVVYIKSSVSISEGNGTQSSPYVLQ